MHSVESIKAAALAGVYPDYFGRMRRGAIVTVGPTCIVSAQVDSGTGEINLYLNGRPIHDEAYLARVLAEPWRQADNGFRPG